MKMTTVMMTVKRNLRTGYYYVASINAMMTQSHKEVDHMIICSFIVQKLPEQCHLILLRESSSWTTKRRNDTPENPPVGDKPVYAFPSQSSSLLAQHGHSIYGQGFLKQLLCYRKIFKALLLCFFLKKNM